MSTQRGFGLIEILLVLVVVAVAGVVLYQYMASTARAIETLQEQRPISGAKLVADQATLGSIRSALQAHYSAQGQWPADKAGALAVLGFQPRFQCPGNDFEYDPGAGQVRLLVTDPGKC
jgi:prepilin-type N-terminal cleavage/methylation domain-containing protein